MIEKFYDNLGWREEGPEEERMLDKVRQDEEDMSREHGNNPQNLLLRQQSLFVGDVVLLLRHGERDLAMTHALLEDLDREYAPRKALRLLKEGKERQWREGNHLKYRTLTYRIASLFLHSVESLFSHKHPSRHFQEKPFIRDFEECAVSIPSDWTKSRYISRLVDDPESARYEARALISKFQRLAKREKEWRGEKVDGSISRSSLTRFALRLLG